MSAADWSVFVTAFVTLFVVIDPPGVTPIFASLTEGGSRKYRLAMALKGVTVATGVLFVFAFGGKVLLDAVGIGLPAFSTAGGILLFIMGMEMVFEKRTERRSKAAEHLAEDVHQHHPEHEGPEDISVFPLGIPLVAGPGAIASTVLLMTNAQGHLVEQSAVLIALALVLLLTFLALVFLTEAIKRAGETFSTLLTRIMGIMLTALAVQYVFNGLQAGLLTPAGVH
jgi:multiple antibiotic resistance protein